MTTLLKQAFREAQKLPSELQDEIAQLKAALQILEESHETA